MWRPPHVPPGFQPAGAPPQPMVMPVRPGPAVGFGFHGGAPPPHAMVPISFVPPPQAGAGSSRTAPPRMAYPFVVPTPPVYVPTPHSVPQARDPWLDDWLQRNVKLSVEGDTRYCHPQWRKDEVKARLREVAQLLNEIKHSSESQDVPLKEARIRELLSMFDDEESYIRFKNRLLKTERNKRWLRRKKEKRRQEREAAPSKAEIEQKAEEIRKQKEASFRAELAAQDKAQEQRQEARRKRLYEVELEYKSQIAARLELLIERRRKRQGISEPVTYYDEVKREQDERRKDTTEQSTAQAEDQATETSMSEAPPAVTPSRPAGDINNQVEEKRKRKRENKPNDKPQRRKAKQRHTAVENPVTGELVYQPSYNRANTNPQTLNEIRRAWDCCQVEEPHEGSPIPQDILRPVPPSSGEWARVFIIPGATSDGLHKMKERDSKRRKRPHDRHGAK